MNTKYLETINSAKAPVNPSMIILIGVIFVSTSAPLVKLADTPPFVLGFYRLGIASILLFPWMVKSRFWQKINRQELIFSIGAGFFLALHFASWFMSLKFTSVASSVVLVTLQPIFVVIGGIIFFQEYLSKKAIIGGVIALSGSMLIGWGDFQIGGMALFGDALALLGAIFIAGYMLIGRLVRKTLDLVPYTWIVYTSASVFLALGALAFQQPFYPYEPTQWTIFFLLAVFPTLLGHSLFSWSLKWVKTALVSVAILGEPIGASVLAYFFLSEVPTYQQALGSLIILSGLLIFILNTSNEKENSNG